MKLDEQLKRIKTLFLEGEGSEVSAGAGSTSTSSSGQYISADAWAANGILTDDGRQDNIGELPSEVDITGGDSREVTLSVDDVFGKDPSVDMVDIMDDLIGDPASALAPPPSSPLTGDDDVAGDDDRYGDDDDDYGHPTKEREEVVVDDVIAVAPCCEPCDDGMWKKCNTDNCIYGSISDCELADQDGESNLESLSLSDIWGTE